MSERNTDVPEVLIGQVGRYRRCQFHFRQNAARIAQDQVAQASS